MFARLRDLGGRAQPIDVPSIDDLERRLGVELPATLRSFYSIWGDAAPRLLRVSRALELSGASSALFPYDDDAARAAIRPGEYAFLEGVDPPGTWPLADDDNVRVHLVVTGEQRGTIWVATPHGLAPAYYLEGDEPIQHSFETWYEEALGATAPTEESALTEPVEVAEVADSDDGDQLLPDGDPSELRRSLEQAAAGAVLDVAPGRYQLDGPIVLLRPVVIEGRDRVELVAASGSAALEVRAGRVAVRGVALSGAIAGERSGVGVRVCGTGALHLSEVAFRGLTACVQGLEAAAILLDACELLDAEVGVELRGGAVLDAAGCRIVGAERGVALSDRSSAHLGGCDLSFTAAPVRMESDGAVQLDACRLENLSGTGLHVTRGRAHVADSSLSSLAGECVCCSGGRTVVSGSALHFAATSCVVVRDGAHAAIEHSVVGAANYGTFVEVDDEGSARLVGNLYRGENLDCVFLSAGRAELRANHFTGSRQYGVHVVSQQATLIGNESYRNGCAGMDRSAEYVADNLVFDNEWEERGRPRRARFGSRPADLPGTAERACVVTGIPCVGPTRVFIVDRQAPTVPLTLPVLATMSAGEIVRAELSAEGEELLRWLGLRKAALPAVLTTLLGEGIARDGRRLGAVLVDDAYYCVASATAAREERDRSRAPTEASALFEWVFDDPALARSILGTRIEVEPASIARLHTLGWFRRGGGLAPPPRWSVLAAAVLEGRAPSFSPAEAAPVLPANAAFPRDEALRSLPREASSWAAAAERWSEDDAPRVDGVVLPRGRWVAGASGAAAKPVAWVATHDSADAGTLGRQISARHAEHGLWPIVTDNADWIVATSVEPDGGGVRRVERFLADRWRELVVEQADDDERDRDAARARLAPFGDAFPGLAPRGAEPLPEHALEPVLGSLEGRVVLVRCQRLSDALEVLGWLGSANHFDDVASLAAVVRSWEERFGASLVGLGSDTMTLLVACPPADLEHARRLAAEHFAVCPDLIDQGAETIEAYAATLVASPRWRFWWD